MKNQTTVQENQFMRVNGSVHINHIEAKHGEIDFVKKLSKQLPKDLYATVFHNENRFSSVSSVIVSIYGEMNTDKTYQWFHQWTNTLVNTLGAPVESAIFDVLITDPVSNETETHILVFRLEDGKLHTYRKNNHK